MAVDEEREILESTENFMGSDDELEFLENTECFMGMNGEREFLENNDAVDSIENGLFQYEIKVENKEVQTEPIQLYCEMQKELKKYKELSKKLQQELTEVKIQLEQANKVVQCMRSVFTEGQINNFAKRRSLDTE
ncbi:uncharacterized protein isoform X2 [Musca autumnalis]